MIIIYNITGVFVVLMLFLLWVFLAWLDIFPKSLLEDGIAIAFAVFLAGLISEKALQPRFFYMPLWFIGLVAFCWVLFARYGVIGIGGGVVVLMAGLAALIGLMRRSAKKTWHKQRKALFDYETSPPPTPLEKKLLLSSALQNNSAAEPDALMAHTKTVIDYMLKDVPKLISFEEKQHINAIKMEIDSFSRAQQNGGVNLKWNKRAINTLQPAMKSANKELKKKLKNR